MASQNGADAGGCHRAFCLQSHSDKKALLPGATAKIRRDPSSARKTNQSPYGAQGSLSSTYLQVALAAHRHKVELETAFGTGCILNNFQAVRDDYARLKQIRYGIGKTLRRHGDCFLQ